MIDQVAHTIEVLAFRVFGYTDRHYLLRSLVTRALLECPLPHKWNEAEAKYPKTQRILYQFMADYLSMDEHEQRIFSSCGYVDKRPQVFDTYLLEQFRELFKAMHEELPAADLRSIFEEFNAPQPLKQEVHNLRLSIFPR